MKIFGGNTANGGNLLIISLTLSGSAVDKKLIEIVTRPRLIAAIRKLSTFHQTSGLEAKHVLDNLFACKNTYFFYIP